MGNSPFSTIEEALADLRQGKMVIVCDDEDRENEGDLVVLADWATPEAINFMVTHGRGLVCVPITEERAREVGLSPMAMENSESQSTAFTVSVDAREGTTTGISAFDRAATVAALIEEGRGEEDFRKPGHIFPLVARKGGVLRRAGHTEAAVDLARLAGGYPAGVICEILNEDGSMARVPDLIRFSQRHGLKMITIADLITYRKEKEVLIRRAAEAMLPTEYGEFRILVYTTLIDEKEHVALVMGEIKEEEPVLVRVHSECLTGDIFGSYRCDCGPQLHAALEKIAGEGKGVLLYMRQEGRGIGLVNKIKAYHLQEGGFDTVEANERLGLPADLRDYGIGAQILRDLGVGKMRLMTNNPRKMKGLTGHGLSLVERVPLEIGANSRNRQYLVTKKEKMGHLLMRL